MGYVLANLLMKTLLRNMRTGVYFQGLENWTNDLQAAFDFKLPDRAVRFVRDAHLDKVELVLAFDNPGYNIPLPLDERFGLNLSPTRRAKRREHARMAADQRQAAG